MTDLNSGLYEVINDSYDYDKLPIEQEIINFSETGYFADKLSTAEHSVNIINIEKSPFDDIFPIVE